MVHRYAQPTEAKCIFMMNEDKRNLTRHSYYSSTEMVVANMDF
jgi:hypothetical protein